MESLSPDAPSLESCCQPQQRLPPQHGSRQACRPQMAELLQIVCCKSPRGEKGRAPEMILHPRRCRPMRTSANVLLLHLQGQTTMQTCHVRIGQKSIKFSCQLPLFAHQAHLISQHQIDQTLVR